MLSTPGLLQLLASFSQNVVNLSLAGGGANAKLVEHPVTRQACIPGVLSKTGRQYYKKVPRCQVGGWGLPLLSWVLLLSLHMQPSYYIPTS